MWFVVGGVLVVLGGLLTWRMVRHARGGTTPGSGIAMAVGLALVFWGVAALVVGLVTRA